MYLANNCSSFNTGNLFCDISCDWLKQEEEFLVRYFLISKFGIFFKFKFCFIRERPSITSDVLRPFFTILPTQSNDFTLKRPMFFKPTYPKIGRHLWTFPSSYMQCQIRATSLTFFETYNLTHTKNTNNALLKWNFVQKIALFKKNFLL